MTKLSARRAATRDRLVEAATTVFAEKGVLGATVEEICEEAGFTRGAFYSNFSSKDELCLAVLEDHFSAQRAALQQAISALDGLAENSEADELIRAALEVFFAARSDDRRTVLTTQELRLYAARSPELAAAYRGFHQRSTAAVAEIIEQTVQAHGYTLAASGPETIGVLHAVYGHASVDALLGGPEAPREDVRTRLLTEVLRALIRPARPHTHPAPAPEGR